MLHDVTSSIRYTRQIDARDFLHVPAMSAVSSRRDCVPEIQ